MGETIITVASVITAIGVIFGVIFAIYKWYLKQEKQDKVSKIIRRSNSFLQRVSWLALRVCKNKVVTVPLLRLLRSLKTT